MSLPANATNLNTPAQPPKLLDQVRERLRTLHYSLRTEQSYVNWIKRFIVHHGKRHPREIGAGEVQAFLTHLAVVRHVSASTQNQALAALLRYFRDLDTAEDALQEACVRAIRAWSANGCRRASGSRSWSITGPARTGALPSTWWRSHRPTVIR